jgi:methylenetetrahydrofolate reductase (NADPH)
MRLPAAAQDPTERQRKKAGELYEIIQQVRETRSLVHVMAYRQEELVADIVLESGLLPRPIKQVAS